MWIIILNKNNYNNCNVACMLIFLRRKKKASFKVYIKATYKVHIQTSHKQSPYKVHGIYHISSPPSKVSFNVCTLHQIESGDFVYGMNDERCPHCLRSRHCRYYFLYHLDVDFPYSFLPNRCY